MRAADEDGVPGGLARSTRTRSWSGRSGSATPSRTGRPRRCGAPASSRGSCGSWSTRPARSWAMALLQLNGEGTCFIARLAVERDQRGLGLGQALLVDAFAVGREHGATARSSRRTPGPGHSGSTRRSACRSRRPGSTGRSTCSPPATEEGRQRGLVERVRRGHLVHRVEDVAQVDHQGRRAPATARRAGRRRPAPGRRSGPARSRTARIASASASVDGAARRRSSADQAVAKARPTPRGGWRARRACAPCSGSPPRPAPSGAAADATRAGRGTRRPSVAGSCGRSHGPGGPGPTPGRSRRRGPGSAPARPVLDVEHSRPASSAVADVGEQLADAVVDPVERRDRRTPEQGRPHRDVDRPGRPRSPIPVSSSRSTAAAGRR